MVSCSVTSLGFAYALWVFYSGASFFCTHPFASLLRIFPTLALCALSVANDTLRVTGEPLGYMPVSAWLTSEVTFQPTGTGRRPADRLEFGPMNPLSGGINREARRLCHLRATRLNNHLVGVARVSGSNTISVGSVLGQGGQTPVRRVQWWLMRVTTSAASLADGPDTMTRTKWCAVSHLMPTA
jgi:hypothetical protein